MKFEDFCSRQTLASAGPCRVDACSCGRIHLHLGPVSMCLDPGVLQHVARAASEADKRLRAPLAEPEPDADTDVAPRPRKNLN